MGNIGREKRSAMTSGIMYLALLLALVAVTLVGAAPAQAGSAGLSWTAPTTNTNGTALTDLGGYKLHIGTASRSYTQNIDVGKLTNYQASNLTDGSTYYFAVTSYDTAGLESGYSNEVSKVLPAAPITYTITATASAGGTITATGNTSTSTVTSGTSTITSVTVTSGANQAFAITPATGYSVSGVLLDGASIGAVTSYTCSAVKANHTITASFAAATATPPLTSSSTWLNQAIAAQSGSFTASFDMTPSAIDIDAMAGFSPAQATAFTGMAAIVRFNSAGNIDARNGGAYAAKVAMPYAAGKAYHVRLQINVTAHTYDVYVTPAGGTETQLASGYAFRTEQATAKSLAYLTLFSDSGSLQLKNLSVTSP